jgi:hypothetical protein
MKKKRRKRLPPERAALARKVNRIIDRELATASIAEVEEKARNIIVALWGIRDDPNVDVAVMGYWDVLEGEELDDEGNPTGYIVQDDTLLVIKEKLQALSKVAVVHEGTMGIDERRGHFYDKAASRGET